MWGNAGIGLDITRKDIRDTMRKWGIDPSEFEILWEESTVPGMQPKRLPGAVVHYMRMDISVVNRLWAFWRTGWNKRASGNSYHPSCPLSGGSQPGRCLGMESSM